VLTEKDLYSIEIEALKIQDTKDDLEVKTESADIEEVDHTNVILVDTKEKDQVATAEIVMFTKEKIVNFGTVEKKELKIQERKI